MGCIPLRNILDIVKVFQSIAETLKQMFGSFQKVANVFQNKDISKFNSELINTLGSIKEETGKLKIEFDQLNTIAKDYPFMRSYLARVPKVTEKIVTMMTIFDEIKNGTQKIMDYKPPKVEDSVPQNPIPQNVDFSNPLGMIGQVVEMKDKIVEDVGNLKEKAEKAIQIIKQMNDGLSKLDDYFAIASKGFNKGVGAAEILGDKMKI